jgi:tetratricopeptide (TPR) repeat protein
VARLVDRCLSFDPRERPPSMDAVVAVLDREEHAVVRLLRTCQQRPRLTALACASVVLLLASGLAWSELADPRYMVELAAARRAAIAGEYVRAGEHYGAAVAGLPPDADPQLRLTMLYERGRARLRQEGAAAHDAAYDDFMEVLRIDPRHAAARASAGYARVMDLMAGRETARSESVLIASARDDFEQALKLGLDTPELRFDLACCRLWVGDISTAAVETLRNLRRELAPQGSKRDVYLATLNELARIEYLDSGRRIPDTSYCEEATKQAPDRGDIAELAAATMLRRAELEANLQNSAAASATFDRAAEYFGRAVELGVATDKLAALRSLNPRTAGDSRFAIPTVDRSAVATSPPQQWFFDPVESLSRGMGIEQSR